MALKNLSVEEMVTLSEAWVTPGNPAHQALSQEPRLHGLVSDLTVAHGAIHAVTPRTGDPRKAEIARIATEEDIVHDRLARGVYGLLTEAALLDEQGEQLIAVRDQLMPDGVAKVTQATYRGQAGHAALTRQRLTPELRAALAGVPLRQGNLLARVDAWLAAADRLGALEEERARLDGASGSSLGKQTVDARNGWIRVVNALTGVAALAELDEAKERTIFGPLRDAEAKADLRTAKRSAGKVVPPGDGLVVA
jgi:hypothetical protein